MPTKSKWTIPIPDQTLASFLFKSRDAKLDDKKPLLIDAERPESYYFTLATFRLWAQRLAAGLTAKGLKPGDRVMLYSGNTLFFPIALSGVVMAGGIFTGANPSYTAREVAFQIENSGATFLICGEAAIDVALDAVKQVKGFDSDRVFVFDNGYDTFDEKGKGKKGLKHWSALMASKSEGAKFAWKDSPDMANNTICLNYSSGTTGLPKGVEITHKNYISNALQHMYLTELKPGYDKENSNLRWLCFLPMYHAMAQTIFCVGAPSKNVSVYIMRQFDFVKMLENIQNFKITDLSLVPPIVVMMTKRPETKKYDLSSVEGVGAGAAPLGREVVVEFEKLWPNGQVNLKQGYGMTEITCSVLGWDPNDHCEDYSVGEPNANCEVKLMDPEEGKKEVKDGERGEVWAKGPNVMKGYWKNEKATKETLTPDGWLRTGDIAYKDEHGRFFIVDRMKELIKVKGMQVAPAELEAQLLEHDGISDACVVGVTIEGNEHPRAYVVQAAGKTLKPEEVAEYMKTKVTKHKWLTGGVKVEQEIEKNPSGKILRKNYRERAKKEVGDGAKKESRL